MLRTKRTLGLLLFLSLSAPVAFAQCTAACPDKRIFSVQATGTASADADSAAVHVGYKVFGADAQSAYSTASQASKTIMDAILRLGLAKTSVESSSQVIEHTPAWELQQRPLSTEERQHIQFTVAQSWIVQVKPAAAAAALHAAIEAGANESGWIEWKVSDPTTLQAKASAQALANARTIAEATMKNSGAHLGQLLSVTGNQQIRADLFSGGGVVGSLGIGSINGRQQDAPLAVNSRRVEYTVSSYVTFALEP